MAKAQRYDHLLMARDAAAAGLTAKALADLAGLNKRSVARFLRGDTQAPGLAKRLAEALGVDLARYVVAGVTSTGVVTQ